MVLEARLEHYTVGILDQFQLIVSDRMAPPILAIRQSMLKLMVRLSMATKPYSDQEFLDFSYLVILSSIVMIRTLLSLVILF
jgi:hypothetical protein